ncbi:TIGR03750 family conjugal transfer protein [Klebsiella pneumoniae]
MAAFFWWSSSGCSTRLRTSCDMATIPFLPDRLNREPVVWRGLTTSELFLALAIGLSGGCAFGMLLALLTDYWPLIPGSALTGAALLIQGGGRILARAKRGKPDSWLPQAVLAWLERHHLRGAQLIQHSAVWVVRRSPR